jgi:hypothetical protein
MTSYNTTSLGIFTDAFSKENESARLFIALLRKLSEGMNKLFVKKLTN